MTGDSLQTVGSAETSTRDLTRRLINDLSRFTCPVCSATDLSSLGSIAYAARTTFAGTPVELSLVPELASCSACGSWFTQRILPERVAMPLYAQGRGVEHWHAPEFEKGKTTDLVVAVRGLLAVGQCVVDIGCNTGELLDFCRDEGARTFGIEPSVAAQRRCIEKGHEMEATLAGFRGSVDLILAFDLIEHLYDLPRFLRDARLALRPGGKLALLTGDIESSTARRTGHAWWYVRYPEHIVFPSWSFWQGCEGFTHPVRFRTYASRGYRAGAVRRAVGLARLVAGCGNGLPLIGPDHHLVVLTRT